MAGVGWPGRFQEPDGGDLGFRLYSVCVPPGVFAMGAGGAFFALEGLTWQLCSGGMWGTGVNLEKRGLGEPPGSEVRCLKVVSSQVLR